MTTRISGDFERIIERHPSQASLIRKSLLSNPDFRQLCEDYLLLLEMIAELEAKPSGELFEVRKEYATLSAELELDISRALLRLSDDPAT